MSDIERQCPGCGHRYRDQADRFVNLPLDHAVAGLVSALEKIANGASCLSSDSNNNCKTIAVQMIDAYQKLNQHT